MNNKISSFIKEIRKEKRYPVIALADKIGITVQGLYKWLNKTDSEWNIDSLLMLSEILEFKVIIEKGEVKIMKNEEEETIVKENKYELYEVYENLGDYSIIHIYTPNSNLNYDERPVLLEDDLFLFSTEKECKAAFENCNPVKMYGLLNNKTNIVIMDSMIDIYPYKAKAYYYYSLAKNLEKTKDGYEIIERFEDRKVQIVKANLLIECDDNKLTLVGHSNEINRDSDGFNGFLLVDIDDSNGLNVLSWSDNLEFIYKNNLKDVNDATRNRYFDINRNEILEGDILVKRGITPENDFVYEDNYKDMKLINEYFKNHETIRVESEFNELVFNLRGKVYSLDELDLLMWEKILQD